MPRLRVLLSEGSSLTARETLTCLGPSGYEIEVVDPDPLCLARFSRWTSRVHRCPPSGQDPRAYLATVAEVVRARRIDVVLPTHEQAWLFAVAEEMGYELPMAVAPARSFERLQSKIAFAELLNDLGLPQPAWGLVQEEADLDGFTVPYWLKAPFGTAGRGVRVVEDEGSRRVALEELLEAGQGPLMVQENASGRYGQAQALFRHGDLVAVHTSLRRGAGMGGSAAARIGVDRPVVREHVAALGADLHWHGGMTLDYFDDGGSPTYIECNPRTVEPGNAAAAGINLPQLQIALDRGTAAGPVPRTSRPAVRTHGLLAMLLGRAEAGASRKDLLRDLGSAIGQGGLYADSREQLTPIRRDPPSLLPLLVVLARLLFQPSQATRIAAGAVHRYSVGAEAVRLLREGGPPHPPSQASSPRRPRRS